MARNNSRRRLAAIVSLDVVGFSRLMETDEEGTLASLKAHLQELVEPLVAAYCGRVVNRTGDGLLLEFRSVVEAVRYSIDVQEKMATRNIAIEETHRIEFRVGANLGDVITDSSGDIFGHGVNIAARLQSIAEAGGVCVSQSVANEIRQKIGIELEDLGKKSLKNIEIPIHAYRVKRNPAWNENIAAQSKKHQVLDLRPSDITTGEGKVKDSTSFLEILKDAKELTFVGDKKFWVTGDYECCREILDHRAFRRPHWSYSNEDDGKRRNGAKREGPGEVSEWPIFDTDYTRSFTKYPAARLLLNLNYAELQDHFSNISKFFITKMESSEIFDLFEEYCKNITISVSAHIFGIKVQDMRKLFDYSSIINKMIGSIQVSDEDINDSSLASKRLRQYILDNLDQIKTGIMSQSIFSVEKHYGIESVVQTLSMLIFGANTTTPMMISNLARFLGESEKNLQMASFATKSDNSRMRFINELLRLCSPTFAIPRIAIQDVTIRNQIIETNQVVYCSIWAANRDPKIFPDPERFVTSRDGRQPNLSFGSKGHKCIGQRLDFLELTVCMRDLVQLFCEHRLIDCDIDCLDTSINTYGLRSLTMTKRDQILNPNGKVAE